MDHKEESSEDKQKRLNCFVGLGVSNWSCYRDCAFWNGDKCTNYESPTIEEAYSIEYTGETCPNCGRLRVEMWSNDYRICEKCNWNLDKNEYESSNI